MKKQLLLVLCFISLLASSFVPGRAHAAPASLPTAARGTNVAHYKEQMALAIFTTALDACSTTYTYVYLGESTFHNPPGKANGEPVVSVNTASYNNCDGSFIDGMGGYALLNKSNFAIDKQLQSANVNADLTLTNWVSGAELPVHVALTWSGTGALDHNKSSYQFDYGQCQVKSRFQGKSRTATANGSVISSDGAITLVAGSSTDALLQAVKTGEVVTNCN